MGAELWCHTQREQEHRDVQALPPSQWQSSPLQVSLDLVQPQKNKKTTLETIAVATESQENLFYPSRMQTLGSFQCTFLLQKITNTLKSGQSSIVNPHGPASMMTNP